MALKGPVRNLKNSRNMNTSQKKFFIKTIVISSLIALFFGFLGGSLAYDYLRPWAKKTEVAPLVNSCNQDCEQLWPDIISSQEALVISTVKKASPSVVSIIIYKEVPIYENVFNPWNFFQPFDRQQKGTQRQEVGGGTGFVVLDAGLILTNKHVAEDKDAEYDVITNDGDKYDASVLAIDPFQDLALLKIDNSKLPALELADSDSLQIGQTVVAIGNALGEFRNTVSVGVISGLGRSLTAGSGLTGQQEILEEVIQTDAAINQGNSGGPLLNLEGKVIGINTARASGADNIGFVLPINKAKKIIKDIQEKGRIIYAFLGVRYAPINKAVQEANNLPYDYGVLVIRGADVTQSAVMPGSAADKAGIKENDIILEIDGVKIDEKNTLAKLIQKHNPGDDVSLKIWRAGEEKTIKATLGEYNTID